MQYETSQEPRLYKKTTTMNIEQLIQERCPNGVEWKTLGELGNFYSGLSGKSKTDFNDGNAKYVTYVNIYQHPKLSLEISDFVKVEEDERQNSIQYGDILFTGSSETPDECGMSAVVCDVVQEAIYLNSFCFGYRLHNLELFDPAFLSHWFRCWNMRKAIGKCANGVTRFNLSKKEFAKIEIPLPPLEIQSAIADILDKFTALTAELEAELEGRKKQYDFYRNRLLSFDYRSDSNLPDEEREAPYGGGQSNVRWVRLEDAFELRNGYTPSKSIKAYWENGTIPWFRMEDIRQNGRILKDSIQHITPEAVKGAGLFAANSFILATTATIGEHALLIADSLANQQFTNLKIRKSLEKELNTKFFFYYMFIIDEWCKNNTNVSGFASVDMGKLKKLMIPIPPLAEQERIVKILDKFDALTSDLTQGLPAEIEARRQQYEYYREKLLSF